MTKQEKALKVATITLASLYKEDFIRVFGKEKIRELLDDTESFAKENVEKIMYEALYTGENQDEN